MVPGCLRPDAEIPLGLTRFRGVGRAALAPRLRDAPEVSADGAPIHRPGLKPIYYLFRASFARPEGRAPPHKCGGPHAEFSHRL